MASRFLWTVIAHLAVFSAASGSICSDDECPGSVQTSSMLQAFHERQTIDNQASSLIDLGDGSFNMMDPMAVENRVASLVAASVINGVKMSSMNLTLITEVINMMRTSVQPSINQTHLTEARNVELRFREMTGCNDDQLKMEATVLPDSEAKLKEQSVTHKACLDEKTKVVNRKSSTCNRFMVLLNETGTQGPAGFKTCNFPTAAYPTNIKAYLKANSEYFKKLKPLYSEHNKLCSNATQILGSVTTQCDAEKGILDPYQCNFCDDIQNANSGYRLCYTRSVEAYGNTTKTIEPAVASRKAEWSAIEKATCYLNVLREPEAAQKNKLLSCQTMTVNTKHLDLDVKPAPDSISPKYAECTPVELQDSNCGT